MLKVTGLYKSFGKVEVLKGASLEVKSGEIVVVVGASGGGKTTLLRSINYLEKCSAGSIEIAGEYLLKDGAYASKEEIRSIRRNIGLVFQSFNLFPHKSVLDNYFKKTNNYLSDYCIVDVFIWSEQCNTEYCIKEDFLFVKRLYDK